MEKPEEDKVFQYRECLNVIKDETMLKGDKIADTIHD